MNTVESSPRPTSLLDRFSFPFFFFLTLLTSIIILSPYLNYQPFISQGDHGRDLYCFKKTMEGALPYRDYSWLFGPLMPYYYALFYKFLGVSIQSVLVGQMILTTGVSVLIFLIGTVFLTPVMSFLCALWYLAFRQAEFFYTYNHIGGIVALLACIYFLFRYIAGGRMIFIRWGIGSLFLLMLIRLNMGISSLVAFLLCLFIVDKTKRNPLRGQNQRHAFFLCALAVGLTAMIYSLLFFGTPEYVVRQSLPFSQSQRADLTNSPLRAIGLLVDILFSMLTATPYHQLLACIFLLLFLHFIVSRRRFLWPESVKINFPLVFACLGIFIFFDLHEFVASGVHYRLYWVMSLALIAIFYFSDLVSRLMLAPFIRKLFLLTIVVVCWMAIRNQYLFVQMVKHAGNGLFLGTNKVFTQQSPDWFQTVRDTTSFLQKNVPANETFFAAPFDPIYYFLTGKDAPTRQLVFFEHFSMPEAQDREVMADLENHHVNYVVLSNRGDTPEPGLGTFGKTYGVTLAKYLEKNFTAVASFGDWRTVPGWAWNHATMILKRKNSI